MRHIGETDFSMLWIYVYQLDYVQGVDGELIQHLFQRIKILIV